MTLHGLPIALTKTGLASTYSRLILATARPNLIAYWPLWEPSGATADNLQGLAARDGSYTGVTLAQPGIGDGRTCPLFDGANDYCDVYSASLRDAFNGAEGAVALWAKVSGAGVWTDGVGRRLLTLYADGDNQLQLYKHTDNNKLSWYFRSGGTVKTADKTSVSTTGWFHIAFTWSETADEVKFYYNGIQDGATVTGLGTWAGNLDSVYSVIGAYSTAPANIWDGYLAHFPVWTTPLSADQVLALATV